jgi:ABC-type amino acid transport substrate-binding protein
LAIGLMLASNAWAVAQVKVGGYPFPPFVDGKAGVAFDLMEAMNLAQTDYVFVFVETSAKRRYQHLAEGRFDLMLFESQAWGWDPAAVEASQVFLSGDGEVFVARALPGRNQTYFDNVKALKLVGTLGYHYAFANFEADPLVLQQNFRITLVSDPRRALPIILNDAADVAVVTRSFLQGYLKANPKDQPRLLVSDRTDQVYQHTVLVRKGGKPGAEAINRILKKLEASGALKKIWAKHGIEK